MTEVDVSSTRLAHDSELKLANGLFGGTTNILHAVSDPSWAGGIPGRWGQGRRRRQPDLRPAARLCR